ncbi:Ig-like domain-containing protein [Spirosoma fluviale]|uniref:Por secretion system C-terminal sorting domain-containing protein n=1 Tax=Spirosoma fluviale TaxID=1597977 RepID=A0A286G3H7_9BACT|nr:T9SS type A sorting domain-containing protein [Spirosoma fluviale]SOD90048.1 Por secretion system C-terminal sorting domain-containing protein [Spirosoma fluviale]
MTLHLRIALLTFFVLSIVSKPLQAQITVTSVTPGTVCAGSTITVAFASPYDDYGIISLYLYGPGSTNMLLDQQTVVDASGSITATIPIDRVTGTYSYFLTRTSYFFGVPTFTASNSFDINAHPVAPGVTNVSYCQDATNIPALTATGQNVKWYDTQQGGEGTIAVPTLPTSVGTTNYYVSQTVNGCESDRANLQATIKPLPDKPIVAASVTYCQDVTTATPLSATATGTLNWYYTASGGTGQSSITPLTNATANYFVSQTVNGCEGPRAMITVTINAKPGMPAVMAPVAYCQDATAIPLSATVSTGNYSLRWYGTDATAGTGSTIAPTPQTGTPSVLSYYVTQQDPVGCESDRASIPVTVNPTPAKPVITDLSVCQNSTPVSVLSAVTVTGILKWYTASTEGTGSTVAPTLSTTTAGQTTYYVSQTDGNGCESDRASIKYTVFPLPVTPTVAAGPLFYCQDATPSPFVASAAGILKWYTTLTGTVPLVSPVPSTSLAGSATYYVSQTDGNGCESDRASVTVVTSSRPALPSVVLPPAYCLNTTPASLSATAFPGNTLRWYGMDETGGTASLVSPLPATGSAGVFRYYVSQVDGNGCESDRAVISVTVNALPSAPATSPIDICQNATVPLITSAVSAAGSLKWYTSPASSASTVAPVLSSSSVGATTYYVTQTDGNGCESSQASILVTVKPLPPAPVVPTSPIILCQSSVAAPLSATGTGTLVWYDPAGNPFPSLTPSTATVAPSTYKVSQIVNGCEGPTASITVIVIAKPNLPLVSVPAAYCQFESPVQLSATGLNLNWFTDPVGGSPSTVAPTPSGSTPGVTSYYVTQTDGNGCESDRASIAVRVKAKPALPGTAPVSFCANQVTALTATTATGGSLTWYGTDPVAGTPSSTAPVPATAVIGAPVLYYVSQTVDGCESDKASVAVTIIGLPPAPTVSSTPITYCQGVVSVPLSATATGTVSWYTVQAGGTPSATAPSPQTTSSNPGTSYYYVSQTVNGCEGPRATIAVTINPKPAQPLVTPSVVYCQNAPATVLAATAPGLLQWYADATGGAAIAAPTPITTTPGVTSYYVTQTDGNGCESDRASIAVQVKAKPALPGTAPVSFCANQVTALTATTATGGSLTWYGTDPVAGTPSSTAPVPATAVIGAPVLYYVSQTVDGCESDKASVAVTIIGLPPAPTVSSTPITYCQGVVSVPLSATATGTVSWYTVQAGGTPSATAPSPQTTSSNPGTSYYYVSQTVNGCEGPRATIAVTINPKPAQPLVTPSVVYCQNAPATVLAATAPGLLQWYADATGGAAIAAPTPITTTPGVTSYYVMQTDGNGCTSDRAVINVSVLATPVAPATTPFVFCQNTAPTSLTATPSSGGILNWYTDPTGGVGTITAPAPSTFQDGTFTYYVSQSISGCEGPRNPMTVTVKALPTAPGVTSNQVSTCLNAPSVALAATPSSGGILNWYTTQTGGVPTSTAPLPPTNQEGTLIYYVSQTVNGCEGSRTPINVVVRGLPVAPGVSTSPIVYCQGATTAVALTAVQTNGATLNWYGSSSGSVASTIAPTPSTTSTGIFTFYVSQSINGCEGPKSLILVIIQTTPTAPTVSNVQLYCQGGTATPVSATASPGGVLNWYTAATGGGSSLTPPTPALTSSGNVLYYVSQSINGCEGPRTPVNVTIKSAPPVPTVAGSPAFCQGTVASPLVAIPAAGGTLNWYTAQTGGSGTSVAPSPVTTSAGIVIYYVSQTDITGCESNRAPVTVRINALPTSPTTASVSYCQGATALPLTALANSGSSLSWYTAQTGGTAVTVTPVPITTNAGVNTYFVSQTDANGCESSRSLLLVVVTPTPTAPSVTPLAPVCQNSVPIVLQASGQNLKWYADATSINNMGSSVTVSTAQAGPFSYYVSQTINQCESPRTLVQGVVNALPLPPTVANLNVCQDVPTQPLTAVGTALQWYDSADNPIAVPTPVTKVDVNQTYIYKVTQTLNGCISQKATMIYTVNVTPPPTVVTPVAYCQNAVAKPLEATGTSLRWYSPTGAITTVAPIPPTIVVTAGASYSVSQLNALGCESRKSEIKVTINALPTARLAGTTNVSLGTSAILSLTLTGTGPYRYVLSDGAVGTAETSTSSDITVNQLTVTPSTTTSYSVVSVSNACGNGTVSGVATISVEVPSILTGTLGSSSICTGTLLTVPFATSGKFTAANTFVVEIASATGDSLSRRYTPIANGLLQGNTVVTTIPNTVAASLYYIRVSATNAPYAVAGIRSPTLLTVRALPTASFSAGKKLIYKSESTELLFTLSGDAPWTVSYGAGAEVRSVGATKNLFPVTVTPATTITYKLLSVSNNCGVGKIEGTDTTTIRVDVLLAEADPFGNLVKVYPVPADEVVTVDIDLPLQKEPAQLQLISFDGHITEQVSTRQKQTTLQLDKASAGTYLLYITIGNKTTVRKILKR